MASREPEESEFDPAGWSDGDAQRHLREGVRSFNAGDYETAHEQFERVWMSTQGSDSDFYKGLIQACIAMHHFQRGNLEGASKLYAGHRRYLAAYRPRHLGIDVAALLDDMQRVLQPAVRRGTGDVPRFDVESRPRIVCDAS
jgi:predicted metal-dependent hydrolase